MTLDEAYQRGQRDMRDRIIKQWRGWITHSIGGMHRAERLGRKGYSNVSIEIRARNKIRALEPKP